MERCSSHFVTLNDQMDCIGTVLLERDPIQVNHKLSLADNRRGLNLKGDLLEYRRYHISPIRVDEADSNVFSPRLG